MNSPSLQELTATELRQLKRTESSSIHLTLK